MMALVDAATIELGGRRFPACDVICPPHPDDPTAIVDDRRLAEVFSRWGSAVYVPAENGSLFRVEINRDGTHDLTIYSPVCEESLVDPKQRFFLPITLMLDTRAMALIPWRLQGGAWDWERAEPEWIAEAIDRWGRWPVVGVPTGPRATIRPLPTRTAA